MDNIMKFDQLPNEILIECFEYLNALDIFYSFDRLNYCFHTLIRNIPLHLNLPYKNKPLFGQFFQKMLFNPRIRNNIISLEVSNKTISGQLNAILSFFSFIEFVQLRSLTLIDLDGKNNEETKSILSLLSNFLNVYSNDMTDESCEILSKLLLSKIQMKLISNRKFDSITIHKTIAITSLTVCVCSLNDLWQLFKYVPMLKYLHIETLSNSPFINNRLDVIRAYAFHLKQFIVDYSTTSFEIFQLLLRRTPNLKILTMTVDYQMDIVDGERWQNLIESSLHHLNIFDFRFIVWINDIILNKFYQFQTDFWYKHHHWYVNCEFDSVHAKIYTIPYAWNEYKLKSDTKRYGITLMNNSKIFENVTDLFLFLNVLNKKLEYYFQNIKSLTLYKESIFSEELDFNLQPEEKFLESLQMIVNLYKLQHLDIKYICNIISPTILLEILKRAPKLSSIGIKKPTLMSFLINDELCQYFNQMIKILDIESYSNASSIKFDELNEFCKIFSNVEQLQCCIDQTDVFLFIVNHMPKLKDLEVHSLYTFSKKTSAWLKMTASKSNIKCTFL